MSAEFSHVPVLAQQVLTALSPHAGGCYVDGTLGGGGHAELVLHAGDPNSRLLGIDRDPAALAAASARLASFGQRFSAERGNFADINTLATQQGFTAVDGILLDIGVSSHQLDSAERGFSYMQDAPLDMRMDSEADFSAFDLVNNEPQEELTRILYDYGEERWAARIAQFIVETRRSAPIATTLQLVDVIKRAVPAAARDKDQHPAKRSFQAIRIAVNGELDALRQGLDGAVALLKPGGVLAVITFHSLEDRIVKEKFRLLATDCICPPHQPVCTCGHRALVRLQNKRPLSATESELVANPRSRSARLRCVVRL